MAVADMAGVAKPWEGSVQWRTERWSLYVHVATTIYNSYRFASIRKTLFSRKGILSKLQCGGQISQCAEWAVLWKTDKKLG
jgi:hypothetical protein